jgi:predicted RNA binding protein YcfA (HicA-like mRNA interferase family)
MTRWPRLTGREIIAALRKAGFDVVRVKGSHHLLRHPDGRTTTISFARDDEFLRGLYPASQSGGRILTRIPAQPTRNQG